MKKIASLSAVGLLIIAALCVAPFLAARSAASGSPAAAAPLAAQVQRQDVIRFGIDLKMQPLRLAVAEFRVNTPGAEPLTGVFNQVLWSDLNNAGIFEMVSRSLYPQTLPGAEEEVVRPGALTPWNTPPANAQALAFGNAQIVNNQLLINAFLYDVPGARRILARRYVDAASEQAARAIAHRFADAIIEALGGGTQGVAESKIYYVHADKLGSPVKNIWVMDYDGANKRPITQYDAISTTPAVSPDGSKLAFTTWLGGQGARIYVFSLESMKRLLFTNISGEMNTTPSWSPDGNRLAFAASFRGDSNIYVANANGSGASQLTHTTGVDIAPTWNPKTGEQIAYVSGRGGIPSIYLMDSTGANQHRMAGGEGDAVDPSWSPNGQVLAFAWTRGFAPGNYNVFLLEVASGRLVQLTHGAGRNEHPRFSPDGRHIVFESNRNGRLKQIFTMLADGTEVHALTTAGENTSPVWSAK